MSLLFKVLYAAHAKGTHHKLALDALRRLEGAQADDWRSVFLKHAEVYLQGSKDPDDSFKDFKNHVLHVRDNFWGGAPQKARSWYTHLVEALAARDWPTAVYCAGVTSHYVTDPLMPFHTAQSEAENNIHRACEWSINRSYDALVRMAAQLPVAPLALTDAPNWLEQLVCAGAERSNRDYEKLIAHYDITRGVTDPPSGLDAVAQRLVAELLSLAAATHAVVLQRAFAEAAVAPPEVTLTLETIVATLKIPIKTIAKKLADAEERSLVERMYDELKATGTVEANLPEDDRTVRDLHHAEVVAKRPAPVAAATQFPYAPAPKVETTVERARRLKAEAAKQAEAAAAIRVAAQARHAAKLDTPPPAPAAAHAPPPPPAPATAAAPPPAPRAKPALVASAPPPTTPAAAPGSLTARLQARVAEAGAPGHRYHLGPDADVVDAPSIGPKMADRLRPKGVRTVNDLLVADPPALAAALQLRHVTAGVIVDWQDQARLVMTVPELRGTHAQLLVGAGFRTQAAVAEAEPAELCAKVLAFAATGEGQRVLRQGDPPDIERIKQWGIRARAARAA